MEYSKEDLMEAKRQILGVGENMGTEESKKIWEENAQFWDNAMGDESNEFHREVVRPKVTELLSPNPADYIPFSERYKYAVVDNFLYRCSFRDCFRICNNSPSTEYESK